MDQKQNCKTMNETGMDSAILVNEIPESITSSNSAKRDFHSAHNSNSVILQKSLIIPIFICLIISFGGFIFGWDVGTIDRNNQYEVIQR